MIATLLKGRTRTKASDPDVAAATRDRRAAESVLNEVKDPALVESAVYLLAAAEVREQAALHKAKSPAA